MIEGCRHWYEHNPRAIIDAIRAGDDERAVALWDDNHRQVEDRFNNPDCGGTGKNYQTWVIAADDTQSPEAANSDLVYTTDADFNSFADGRGGSFRFLDGSYPVSTVGLEMLDGMKTFTGVGGATRFVVTGNYGGEVIRTQGPGAHDTFENVTVENMVIDLNGSTGDPIGILYGGVIAGRIRNVDIYGAHHGQGIQVDSNAGNDDSENVWITNVGVYGTIDGGISIFNASRCVVANCILVPQTGDSLFFGGISGAAETVAANNVIRGGTRGMRLDQNTFACLIVGNRIQSASTGILLFSTDAGNTCEANYITGNKVSGGSTAVRVNDADCVDNIIVGNDLRGPATGIQDFGTGTIINWPAGANGDNFP